MTIPQSPDPAPAPLPSDPAPLPPDTGSTVDRRTGRTAMAAVVVFVGGYLVISTLGGQLPAALSGFIGNGMFVPGLLVSQFVFALIVVIVGLVGAVGSGVGKLIGSLVVVVGSVVILALTTMRLNGALRTGPEAMFFFANPWLMTVLLVGVAWLLVRRARLGWLALLGALLLSPVPWALVMAGVDSVLTQLVMLALSAIVGAGILLAGRPWRD